MKKVEMRYREILLGNVINNRTHFKIEPMSPGLAPGGSSASLPSEKKEEDRTHVHEAAFCLEEPEM
jgi:hypothetical protein